MRVVYDLCTWQSLSAEEISKILGRDKNRLKRNILTPLIEDGQLSYTVPDMPSSETAVPVKSGEKEMSSRPVAQYVTETARQERDHRSQCR